MNVVHLMTLLWPMAPPSLLQCCDNLSDETLDEWTAEVKMNLSWSWIFLPQMPKDLRRELLRLPADIQGNQEPVLDCLPSKLTWIVQGVPRRPLYKEVAFRLWKWRRRLKENTDDNEDEFNSFDNKHTNDSQQNTLNDYDPYHHVMVSAGELNFQEIISASNEVLLPLPPTSVKDIRHWLTTNGTTDTIQRLLGLRSTIGSDKGWPPERLALLKASQVLNNPSKSPLTVAARARAKHAHRGKEGYFGLAQGPPLQQNEDTSFILQRMMNEAVWMNRHCFAGVQDGSVSFEIRVPQGYGARWVINEDSEDILFRGFLEPHAADGHERKWRH